MEKNNNHISTKEGSLHSPEIDASVLPCYRDSKALGILRIDDSAVSLCDVSTIDVLHTSFLQLSVQNKHLLSALASQCFPLAGALHMTSVQLKTQSCRTPGLSFSNGGRGRDGDGQSPKGGMLFHSIALQR